MHALGWIMLFPGPPRCPRMPVISCMMQLAFCHSEARTLPNLARRRMITFSLALVGL